MTTEERRIHTLEEENRVLKEKLIRQMELRIGLLEEVIKLKNQPPKIEYVPYPVYQDRPWWWNQPWYTTTGAVVTCNDNYKLDTTPGVVTTGTITINSLPTKSNDDYSTDIKKGLKRFMEK